MSTLNIDSSIPIGSMYGYINLLSYIWLILYAKRSNSDSDTCSIFTHHHLVRHGGKPHSECPSCWGFPDGIGRSTWWNGRNEMPPPFAVMFDGQYVRFQAVEMLNFVSLHGKRCFLSISNLFWGRKGWADVECKSWNLQNFHDEIEFVLLGAKWTSWIF